MRKTPSRIAFFSRIAAFKSKSICSLKFTRRKNYDGESQLSILRLRSGQPLGNPRQSKRAGQAVRSHWRNFNPAGFIKEPGTAFQFHEHRGMRRKRSRRDEKFSGVAVATILRQGDGPPGANVAR